MSIDNQSEEKNEEKKKGSTKKNSSFNSTEEEIIEGIAPEPLIDTNTLCDTKGLDAIHRLALDKKYRGEQRTMTDWKKLLKDQIIF